MKTETSNEIVRLQDGSIDYGHYAQRASIARNREAKLLAGKAFEISGSRGPRISALATVVLLAIIL